VLGVSLLNLVALSAYWHKTGLCAEFYDIELNYPRPRTGLWNVGFNSDLMQLIDQDDFILFLCYESFKFNLQDLCKNKVRE
jgi:hypothetical protein